MLGCTVGYMARWMKGGEESEKSSAESYFSHFFTLAFAPLILDNRLLAVMCASMKSRKHCH